MKSSKWLFSWIPRRLPSVPLLPRPRARRRRPSRQSTFASVHTEAVLNIHFTSNWLFRIVQAELNAFGISHEQYNILRILRGNREGTYCLRDVQERMLNRTANTTRLVEKLRKRSLLSRRPNPTNRRMVGVRITEAGLDLLDEMDGPIQEIERRMQVALSSENARRLTVILEDLRDRLDISGLAESHQGSAVPPTSPGQTLRGHKPPQ